MSGHARTTNREYAEGLGRAFIGAMLFALPLFMTMEMWWFGFTIDRLRLVALLACALPLLVALSHVAGFEVATSLADHVLDAFAAFALAVAAAALVLALLGVLGPSAPFDEIVATIAVCAVPAAIGALLADKQLADGDKEKRARATARRRSHGGRLLIMTVGALFVAFNVAPTEEMVVIAYQLSALQAALLGGATLFLLHALLFTVALPGRAARQGEAGFLSVLLRYSFAGYGVCALVSAFMLWVFGRLDGVSFSEAIEFVIVLSFPAAIGAGLAHFVVGEARDED